MARPRVPLEIQRAKKAAYQRRYHLLNKEKKSAYDAAYYAKHAERILERQRVYYQRVLKTRRPRTPEQRLVAKVAKALGISAGEARVLINGGKHERAATTAPLEIGLRDVPDMRTSNARPARGQVSAETSRDIRHDRASL